MDAPSPPPTPVVFRELELEPMGPDREADDADAVFDTNVEAETGGEEEDKEAADADAIAALGDFRGIRGTARNPAAFGERKSVARSVGVREICPLAEEESRVPVPIVVAGEVGELEGLPEGVGGFPLPLPARPSPFVL